jgi:hypothetical protein
MKTRYLYLPGGFPAIVHEDDSPRYERHPLPGVYTDPAKLIVAYDTESQDALARIDAQPGTVQGVLRS